MSIVAMVQITHNLIDTHMSHANHTFVTSVQAMCAHGKNLCGIKL